MGRFVIKIPCFVLTPWPPLSYGTPSDSPIEMGRRGEPWRNHYDFSGCFWTPFAFPLEGEKRETGLRRKGTKRRINILNQSVFHSNLLCELSALPLIMKKDFESSPHFSNPKRSYKN